MRARRSCCSSSVCAAPTAPPSSGGAFGRPAAAGRPGARARGGPAGPPHGRAVWCARPDHPRGDPRRVLAAPGASRHDGDPGHARHGRSLQPRAPGRGAGRPESMIVCDTPAAVAASRDPRVRAFLDSLPPILGPLVALLRFWQSHSTELLALLHSTSCSSASRRHRGGAWCARRCDGCTASARRPRHPRSRTSRRRSPVWPSWGSCCRCRSSAASGHGLRSWR